MYFLGYVGSWARGFFEDLIDISLMSGLLIQSTIINGFKATQLTTRTVIRQFRFTTLDALHLIFFIGVFFGFVIISQFYKILGELLSEDIFARIIIVVALREIGPLLTVLLLIGRSVSAVTVELGNLRINRQMDLLEASGFDLMHFLVLPRIIALTISCLILTFIFNFSSLIGGVVFAKMSGLLPLTYRLDFILGYINNRDIFVFFVKPIVFGILISLCACFFGIKRVKNINFIPKAATWAIVYSTLFCFIFNFILMLIIPVEF